MNTRPMEVKRAVTTLDALKGRRDSERLLEMAVRLRAVVPDITDQQIVGIIGEAAWALELCNHCDRRVTAVVQVGEEPDHDSATTSICIDCARRAVAALEAQ